MSGASEPAIVVDQLRKRYTSGLFTRKGVDALRGVTFNVGRGEIFGLLGPNGAGKTTVIKILLGIVRSSGGKATLLDFPAGDRRGRRLVGYMPENLHVPRHQTARTAMEFYGRLSGLSFPRIRKRSDALLDQVGLAGRDRESVKRFSKGMLQRLGLAQALLHDPQLLVLDEPTDGLDPVGRSQVRNILVQLKQQGRTVFLNSHLLQEVEMVCDRVAILDEGQLRYEGGIDALTPQVESKLALEVFGQAERIHSALGHRPHEQWQEIAEQRFRLLVPITDGQADIDQLVDQLRQAGVSIANMAWQRRSLEDAFLQIVAQDAEAS